LKVRVKNACYSAHTHTNHCVASFLLDMSICSLCLSIYAVVTLSLFNVNMPSMEGWPSPTMGWVFFEVSRLQPHTIVDNEELWRGATFLYSLGLTYTWYKLPQYVLLVVNNWRAPWKNRMYWYISFFPPSLNRVLFPMFSLLVEGECQILVF